MNGVVLPSKHCSIFLFQCPDSVQLWMHVVLFVNHCLYDIDVKLNWSPEARLLGAIHEWPGHLVNFIWLNVKQYIYASKCLGEMISIQKMFHKNDTLYLVEKYNAIATNKLQYHRNKWYPLTGECTSLASTKESNPGSVEDMAMEYLLDHGVT